MALIICFPLYLLLPDFGLAFFLVSWSAIITDKNDSNFVVHLPSNKLAQFRRLAERQGLSNSELGRRLVETYLSTEKERFEYMKSVFEND